MKKRTIAFAFLLFLLMVFPKPAWTNDKDIDVYLLYRKSSKEAKTQLLAALPKEMVVKTYNVSLLALANFEEKKKVIAEIERARAIVVLSDFPMEVLKGYQLNAGLLIINSVKKTVKSDAWTLYLLAKGTDLSAFNQEKLLEAAREEDLHDIKRRLLPLGVVLVNEKTLGIYKAASMILQTLLGSSG
jgi:hypothetical protein